MVLTVILDVVSRRKTDELCAQAAAWAAIKAGLATSLC